VARSNQSAHYLGRRIERPHYQICCRRTHHRLASNTYAKAVADAGGIMGIWRIFPTMKDYVTGIKQMVDVVGVDHVGIGTDTSLALGDGVPVPGTNNIWPDEKNGFLYSVVQEMLTQGVNPDEISKIAGGNYVRVFGKVTRSSA
jgi:membrane dipeptidase